MIADFLDQSYVVAQTHAQLEWLADLQAKSKAGDAAALAAMKRHSVTSEQIQHVITALRLSLQQTEAGKAKAAKGKAFIPSDPIMCGFQAGMTELADDQGNIISEPAAPPHKARRGTGEEPEAGPDTSPTERLRVRADVTQTPEQRAIAMKAPFVEGEDIHYGLDGFESKFAALFKRKRAFNNKASQPAVSEKPLRLFLFGDWGTGLPLAQEVTRRVREQLLRSGEMRQMHVVHLGDVYYTGEPTEYRERMLAGTLWPVQGDEKERIGSWSLNGNHDMYSGGHGYFDKLLRDGRFLRWHRDEQGEPSSFFVIEDAHWQFFGLDTSWNVPSLKDVLAGRATFKEYGGQNGVLTQAQVDWMAERCEASKGCVLMTHHQPGSSRKSEDQHSDEAVRMLKQAGVYSQIDAWFWGHEHRCVVFKPKAQRCVPRLIDAPDFCACIGHGGVPVPEKNWGRDSVPDVLWQEDRLDANGPMYDKRPIIPFGFARIDSKKLALDIRIYDHTGSQRFRTVFHRDGFAPAAVERPTEADASPHSPQRSTMAAKAPAQKRKAAAPAKKAGKGGRK